MTGIVILAAGESSRIGSRKQKLIFKGKSLLQWAVDCALLAKSGPVIVILGAHGEEIQADLKKEDVIVYHNLEWKEGMSSSIRSGIRVLESTGPLVSGVIFMVCDQPFADENLINKLINKKVKTGKDIVASSYNGTTGVPVLFDKKFFGELDKLKGQEGAKKLLQQHKGSVAEVDFPGGGFDIDTLQDYEALVKIAET